MFAIIGIVVVIGAILGGFLMEKGHLLVLVQPAELVTIGGAALGTLLIANPIHILKSMIAALLGVLRGSRYSRDRYLETIRMMFELCSKGRKDGLLGIENDVEKPAESPIFSKYPAFLADHHVRDFVCDTLRMGITGGIEPFDMDQMMELDMEVSKHDAFEPIHSLTTMADALPGLGIVAAVLGIVVTMGALGGPPEEIGRKVAAALVGTFLGILLCYGIVGPLTANMTKAAEELNGYLHVLRVILISFLKGAQPILAIELGRRAIPEHVRPTFDEMEKACKAPSESPAGASADAPAAEAVPA